MIHTATNSSVTTLPWYKQWAPWLLMAGPAVAVVAGLTTAVIAIKTQDGLVVDDYYKRGKEIGLELKRDQRAVELKLKAQVMFSESKVRILLSAPNEKSIPAKATLVLTHPTLGGRDQQVVVLPIGQGLYEGTLKPLMTTHHWQVHLEAMDWRLRGEWKPAKGDEIELMPMIAAASAE